MKRSIKNVLMIILIILMIGAMYLTINSSRTDNNSMGNPQEMKEGTPPEKPNDDNNGDIFGENMMFPDEAPPEINDERPNLPSNSNTSTITYILLGVESLVIVSTCMYLVLSGFNKKTLNEMVNDKNKLVLYILVMIVLTGGLTYFATTFIDNSNSTSGPNGGNIRGTSSSVTYSSVKEITSDETITSGDYTSNLKDENAINVSGDIKVDLSGVNITKTGDSDGGDNTSFYGTNSAILAKDGAELTIENANITTNATGANGVFSYGGSATTNNSNSDGTTINISDSKITTSSDNSGGIMTTGGGIMNANNLTVKTSGTSSAAIRSDRGGGEVTVDSGTYETSGQGSPTIYSTANIKVSNATLIATASEGVVIEGANSVTLNNCNLTDTNNKLNGQSTTYKNIFLYQSMSGDAKEGGSTFTSKNSKIVTNKGDSFYVTNTSATINLENNDIINNDSTGYFLRSKSDSWGNSGSNGGIVTLNMTNQKVSGNIYIDDISTLSMNMINSNYEGTINADNTAKSISIKLDSASKIKLTADSYITSLEDADTTYSNIDLNGYKLYVNKEEFTK